MNSRQLEKKYKDRNAKKGNWRAEDSNQSRTRFAYKIRHEVSFMNFYLKINAYWCLFSWLACRISHHRNTHTFLVILEKKLKTMWIIISSTCHGEAHIPSSVSVVLRQHDYIRNMLHVSKSTFFICKCMYSICTHYYHYWKY